MSGKPVSMELGHESLSAGKCKPVSMELGREPVSAGKCKPVSMELGREPVSAGKCKPVSKEVGHESMTVSDTQDIQVKKLEPTVAELSIHSTVPKSHAVNANAGNDVEVAELDATMNHIIDTTAYPFTSEPDDDQLNASIMIDPSNPFDEDMIRKFLSKLAQPLSSYENCHCVDVTMPKICARGSIQLGTVKPRFLLFVLKQKLIVKCVFFLACYDTSLCLWCILATDDGFFVDICFRWLS